ncbi:hypothetical protein QTP86_011478 [Hemibagrus guttatus]|nr:hypothetical protein QTP86_011478 [Hemibagrus guttatus]
MDATRTTRQLEETIDLFERQKIRDIKKIFGEFVTVEMAFHAKALEVYTTAYQHVKNVDEEADLESKTTKGQKKGVEDEEEDEEDEDDDEEEDEDDDLEDITDDEK